MDVKFKVSTLRQIASFSAPVNQSILYEICDFMRAFERYYMPRQAIDKELNRLGAHTDRVYIDYGT